MAPQRPLVASAPYDPPPSPFLQRHLARCAACSRRWERAVQLHHLRGRPQPPSHVDPGSAVPYTGLLTPFGTLWIAGGTDGVVAMSFWVDELTFCRDVESRTGHSADFAPQALMDVVDRCGEYFAGRRTVFDLPVRLQDVTPFGRAVLETVAEVPYGSTQSYGDIARAVGKPSAARAVGSVMAANPISLLIPCHRIIRGDGSPGAYALTTLGPCGTVYKTGLLAQEGVRFGHLG